MGNLEASQALRSKRFLTWKALVAAVVGKKPFSLNSCITRFLRCSRTLLCPFSDSLPGVFGVRGDRPVSITSVHSRPSGMITEISDQSRTMHIIDYRVQTTVSVFQGYEPMFGNGPTTGADSHLATITTITVSRL